MRISKGKEMKISLAHVASGEGTLGCYRMSTGIIIHFSKFMVFTLNVCIWICKYFLTDFCQ